MTDMTPAEMRGRAHSLCIAGHSACDPSLEAFRLNVLAGADALDRLADVIEWALDEDKPVIDYESYAIAQGDALTVVRGETTDHEVGRR